MHVKGSEIRDDGCVESLFEGKVAGQSWDGVYAWLGIPMARFHLFLQGEIKLGDNGRIRKSPETCKRNYLI